MLLFLFHSILHWVVSPHIFSPHINWERWGHCIISRIVDNAFEAMALYRYGPKAEALLASVSCECMSTGYSGIMGAYICIIDSASGCMYINFCSIMHWCKMHS